MKVYIKNVLWSKGEKCMKYEKPEMETIQFENKISTLDIVGASQNPDSNDTGGNEW